ncbi:MAG: serine/threonine-protein kinase, partial [Thermosynechococcaceae cyanobacterium]
MKTSRYHILGEVGQGQFGKVFCGSDRATGELVALKSLTHYKFTTRQFLKELAVLVRLKHPNIVSFHGVEYNDTGRYIVMDYCPGGTLRHLMESKQDFPILQKLQIIRDILLGLEHAHCQNVIHCDLKPENILLNVASHGWTAQIADFGIAQFLELSKDHTGHSGHTGSPAYMAPERFYGQYSPESDIYAVGVLLYELLRGKRPFSGMPADIMKAHLNQPLRIPKSLPLVLRAILRKAMQKLPQHRYESAQVMRLAVEAAIASLTHTENAMTQTGTAIVGPDSDPLKSDSLADQDSTLPPTRLAQNQTATLPREALQMDQALPDGVNRLWARPQGCFMAIQNADGIGITMIHPDGTKQDLGILPYGNPNGGQHHTPSMEWLDLDPQGRWLAAVRPHSEAIAPLSLQTPHSGSSQSPIESDEGDAPNTLSPSCLQIFRLPDLQRVCQEPMDH